LTSTHNTAMANRTDPDADTVHGANPQFLVDRIVRVKIYNDAYWKEYCFGLTTESLIDEAAKLDYVAGTYGGRRRPSRFLCLFLKLLQIQPDEDVVLEYIKQPELKYLRALGCAYLRITARYLTVYQTLEPLFADYRKLRYRNMQGKMSIIRMDEFIDWLMREETICDVTMPQMPKREILEQTGQLDVYQSVLEDDLEDLEELERSLKEMQAKEEPPPPEAEKAEASMPKKDAEEEGEKGEVEEKRREERRDDRRDDRRDRRDERERRDRRDGRDDDRKERRDRRDDEKKRKDRDDREERREKKEKKDKKEKDDEKKKKPKYANKADEERAAGHSKKDKDGLTVEESNEIRKRLGLKPLR